MSFRIRPVGGVIVVAPVGILDVPTYADLRDTLFKIASDLPDALVVDLGDLEVARTSVLSVFPTVALRLADWPGIPLLLAGRSAAQVAIRASAVPRFVTTVPTVADAIAAVGEPPPHRRATIACAGRLVDPGRARAWLADVGTSWGLDTVEDLLEDAVLVASELVENAVRHAPGPARLRMWLRAARLSVAVYDSSPTAPILIPAHAASARGGRGIALVDALSLVWGHSPHPDGGKVVWAVLQVR